MAGFVYLIRNKDLYKIGITENLEQRMKQLKPDEIVATLETEDYEKLEKELHKKFKSKRIPQTEYFRLSKTQLDDCTRQLKGGFEPSELLEFKKKGIINKEQYETLKKIDWYKHYRKEISQEEGLEALQLLLKEGLITEEAYQTQKKQLTEDWIYKVSHKKI